MVTPTAASFASSAVLRSSPATQPGPAWPAFDPYLYRERHRIENTFARLKGFRRISTRYDKRLRSFGAMVCLGCVVLWLRF